MVDLSAKRTVVSNLSHLNKTSCYIVLVFLLKLRPRVAQVLPPGVTGLYRVAGGELLIFTTFKTVIFWRGC